MNTQATKWAVAVAVVGVMMLGLVPPSEAAPASSMAILKQAAQSSDVTDVRYYRRSYRGRAYYGNPGAAIGLGILGAAAGAAAYGCVSAWNKDPVFGVIGIQSGPGTEGPHWLPF